MGGMLLLPSLLMSLSHAADVEIHPASASGPSNCIPFGGWYYPSSYSGFIYKNIPAFDLYPGDTIAFDLGAVNDVDIDISIGMAAATSNGGTTQSSAGFTTVVTNSTASSPRGNTTKGDYELAFTVDQPFSFAGGGLIIRISRDSSSSYYSDTNCTQVLMNTSSSDSSGYFVQRFYNDTDGVAPFSGSTSTIGGFEITYGYWYEDNDGDGYGDPSTGTQLGSSSTSGYVRDDTDCDDSDIDTFPGAAPNDSSTDCMNDDDGDDWGDDTVSSGVTAGTDCDDTSASIYVGATEVVADGIDQDCDDVDVCYVDADGDGYGTDAGTTTLDDDLDCTNSSNGESDNTDDCDDSNDTIYDLAAELCDGLDNDCDGSLDDDESDLDNDGYVECAVDSGGWDGTAVTGYEDCDDDDDSVYPTATELCDGLDNDCDGSLDSSEIDDDLDGYVDCAVDGDGWDGTAVTGYEDCDDTDLTIYPTATELCDGLDNDCDGDLDSSESDLDGDGWVVCTEDSGGWDGTALTGGFEDCDDFNADTWPGADEYCDGEDDDCDGDIDEDTAVDVLTWFADTDGDGFGDAATSDIDCNAASGWVSDDTDCDDTNADAWPGATEVAYDGIDQSCDGSDLCDVDGDGYDYDGEFCYGDDCDDDDDAINIGADEGWYDGIDQNCDGLSDYDEDGDGFDSASYGGEDCDDSDPDTYPGAPDEPGDGIITDCDAADEYDADGDGFDGAEYGGTDCDDANSAINPGADEVWYDGVDDDCDGNDDDQDFDGYALELDCDDLDPGVWDDCNSDSGGLDTGGTGEYQGGCGKSSTIPVPATGLLALFGLAALFRRR
jgi:large repetitive protein